jgi:Mn-dependent DtxR family transcriptional regulator
MERDEDEFIAASLAESLEVSTSIMTATLKRKDGDGWIATEQGKDIRLTDNGCEVRLIWADVHVVQNRLGDLCASGVFEEDRRAFMDKEF